MTEWAALLGAAMLLSLAGAAGAEIQDYMIRRLVTLETGCGIESIVRLASKPNARRFKATCLNVSSYPDGLTIACSDIDDDRSCVVETKEQEFKALRLLQPDGPP
ncbi:MAG: hypothetical protein K8F92_18580 [Hyphomicrobium sp.]|uniref:hypothetical protein n=1 Tax=Hyphomicrobium sp. TaxID=82 RepID=UPI00132CC045|nr:hypothetical protein [Hyphomicrobium sp.]KAB2941935.1 MAG: hypothetical protein F9K20_07565 [Hyphomicrobium sp.]MBZ0211636.1 hypothetical protein [Hyphomicrobium sp.]